jgi:glycine/D-amino acid oxidase-like deaminating enzyme
MKCGPPIWWDGAAPGARFPGGVLTADVAIIGGGLAGLSTAYHLLARCPGLRAVVLEAERLGAGASGRTTGMLSPGVGQIIVALRARLGPARTRATYQATLAAVQGVAALVADERIDCELELVGQLVLARSASERRRLGAALRVLRELELPVEALDDAAAAAAVRLIPRGPSSERDGPAGLRYPTAGVLHPVKLVHGLAERVRARGGTVYEGAAVRSIDEQPQRVRLQLATGEVVAEQVVVAASGYAPSLGHLRGRVLPVHLQALGTEPLTAEQRACIGWAGREGLLDGRRLFDYARLTRDQRIVLGGGRPRYRFGGALGDGADGEAALDALAAELAALFPTPPGQPLRVDRGWTGVIGYTVDALPTIATAPGRARTHHLLGWCGHGVALATAAGTWVARLLCDGAVADDLPWFRPRPPLVPTEIARWIGFQAAVGTMAVQDRLT